MPEILAIDDHPPTLKLLQTLLTKERYTVRLATKGSMALASAQSRPPDLILLDINMPEMTGYEVCQRLKADPQTQDIPVIVVSGTQEVFDKVKAFSLGAVDYVTKPFQPEELRARIHTHLQIKSLQQDLHRFNQELETLVKERTMELASVYQIARTISGEIDWEKLLHSVMQIILQSVTADRGVLLWERDHIFWIVAEGKDDVIETYCPFHPIEAGARVPLSVVQTVKETGQLVMIQEDRINEVYSSNASRNDPVPQSLLCMPLLKQGIFLGALYLEDYNNPQAFSPTQRHLLEILSSQIAISLENARLYEEMQDSLHEKEVLLQEIHHRVKNNLQVIASLLTLQRDNIEDVTLKAIFDETRNRVFAMARIHEQLFTTPDVLNLDMAHYFHDLGTHLIQSYGFASGHIRLIVQVKDVVLGLEKAIPCGLIVTELISNSLKYAFPSGATGDIVVTLEKEASHHLRITVRDTGVGFPKDVDFRTVDSLGLTLVRTFAEHQLRGSVDLDRNGGTTFRLTFPQ